MNGWFLLLYLLIANAKSYTHANEKTKGKTRQFAEEFGARLLSKSKNYTIPIYEIKTSPIKNTCSPLCYKEIYDKPIRLLTKPQTSDQFDVINLTEGLKSVIQQDKNKIFHDISQTVGIVFTKYDFPVKQYPHIINTELLKPTNSQDEGEIPYLMITKEKELTEINNDDEYEKVAEINISNEGFMTKINFITTTRDGKPESIPPEKSAVNEGIEFRSSSDKYNNISANLENDQTTVRESSSPRYIRDNLPKQYDRISHDPNSNLEFNLQITEQALYPSLPRDYPPNYIPYPSIQKLPFAEKPNDFSTAVNNLPSSSSYDSHFGQHSSVQENAYYPNYPSGSSMSSTYNPYYTNYNTFQSLNHPPTMPHYSSHDVPKSTSNSSAQTVNHTSSVPQSSCNSSINPGFLQYYNSYPVITSYSSPYGSFFQVLNSNPSIPQSPDYVPPYPNPYSINYRVPISDFNKISTQGYNTELSSTNTTSSSQNYNPPIQTPIVNQSTNSTLEKLREHFTETSNIPRKNGEPKLLFPNKIIINNISVPPENGGPRNQQNFTVHIVYLPQGSSTIDTGSVPEKQNQDLQSIYSKPQYAEAPHHIGNVPPPYSMPAGYSSAFQPYYL